MTIEYLLSVLALSRASPLPQGYVHILKVPVILWERGLPAMKATRFQAWSSATPAPTSPEYGAVTSHTGIPLK